MGTFGGVLHTDVLLPSPSTTGTTITTDTATYILTATTATITSSIIPPIFTTKLKRGIKKLPAFLDDGNTTLASSIEDVERELRMRSSIGRIRNSSVISVISRRSQKKSPYPSLTRDEININTNNPDVENPEQNIVTSLLQPPSYEVITSNQPEKILIQVLVRAHKQADLEYHFRQERMPPVHQDFVPRAEVHSFVSTYPVYTVSNRHEKWVRGKNQISGAPVSGTDPYPLLFKGSQKSYSRKIEDSSVASTHHIFIFTIRRRACTIFSGGLSRVVTYPL
ncbi:8067_t:CDS:2, partial [Diversispora eburnea]